MADGSGEELNCTRSWDFDRLCAVAAKCADVAKLVAWRRGQTRKGLKGAPLISPATVNRSTTEVLKKVFMRARNVWRILFEHWPNWAEHMLKESDELPRELSSDEELRLTMAVIEYRVDYQPAIDFALATGLRRAAIIDLRWADIDWKHKTIKAKGKGGKTDVKKITPAIRDILWPLRGQHAEFVFTYVAQRTIDGRIKGQRYPLTKEGLKSAFRRLRTAAGLEDFRFHDLRHDHATKLLRETRNLKLVQRALNHANIETTLRYVHVLDSEVDAGVEAMQETRRLRLRTE